MSGILGGRYAMEKIDTECLTIFEQCLAALSTQAYANHTIHEVIYALHHHIRFSSLAIIRIHPETENLIITNRYNVAEAFVNSFSRRIGNKKIGELFYKNDLIVIRKDEMPEAYEEFKLDSDYDTGVGIRITVQNRTLGYLAVFFEHPFAMDGSRCSFFRSLTSLIGLSWHIEDMRNDLSRLCRVDEETGLMSYGYFYEQLKHEYDRCDRCKVPLSIALIDLDNFKDVINLHGLTTANQLFCEIAFMLKNSVRKIDMVARYGCDELIVCLAETARENALIFIERFQNTVHSRVFTDNQIQTTLRIGLTSYQPGDRSDSIHDRLYAAIYNARLNRQGSIEFQ